MAKRKHLALKFSDSILTMVEILEVLDLAQSTFLYKPTQNRGKHKGRQLSNVIKTTEAQLIANQRVVNEITVLLAQEFVDYSYLKVRHCLRQEINYVKNSKFFT
ncbi:hypothetical protein [Lacihabitans soyangensis]|uniref:Uncharacterized protein n=1 Tax=Lacihabitans soyangensis TaxID=869394 RepID=A0AAE3H7Q0_9BACT|nr:hypothetical protein [Lacihabitans soyangensis]MCP9765644.1 hypothetical protein [Lacihabitans soyangensis]